MKTSVTVNSPQGVDPFGVFTTRPARAKVRLLINLLAAIIGGGIISRALGAARPSIVAGKLYASSTAACATVTSSGSCTINGQALAATQHRASGTVTAAGVSVADTVTVNGVVFTAAAAENLVTGAFNQSGSDTATATSLAACINASTNVLVSGLIQAKSAAAIVTIYSVAVGTGGNSYTLATSNNTRLAKSGTALANGAAIGNNEFDYLGTDIQTASALAAAINASTTGLVSDHVKASNLAGVVTLASVAVGDTVTIAGVTLTAVAATPTNVLTEFAQSDTDTNDAVALKNLINAHPTLKELVFASNSSGVLTIRQLPAAGSTGLPLSSSNGTRLAVTVASSGLLAVQATVLVVSAHKGTAGNAVTLAAANGVTAGAARLAGGTDATLTF